MKILNGKKYLTTKEAREKLGGISPTTLYGIIAKGAFSNDGDSFIYFKRRLFSEEAIERYTKEYVKSNY